MATFEYVCDKCEKLIEKEFPVGKALKSVVCDCGQECQRHYGGCSFILKGSWSDWPSKSSRLNKEMTKRNEDAGSRMRGTWENTAPKLVDQN